MDELKNIEQKIEDAHQKLLSINQEQYRCSNLLKSDNEKIVSLQQIKIDLEKHVKDLTLKRDGLSKDVSNLQTEIHSLTEDITKSREIFVEINNKTNIELAKCETAKNLIKEENEKLDFRTTEVSNRENNIKELEITTSNKHNKIIAFANELK